jgi:hypothetical protein
MAWPLMGVRFARVLDGHRVPDGPRVPDGQPPRLSHRWAPDPLGQQHCSIGNFRAQHGHGNRGTATTEPSGWRVVSRRLTRGPQPPARLDRLGSGAPDAAGPTRIRCARRSRADSDPSRRHRRIATGRAASAPVLTLGQDGLQKCLRAIRFDLGRSTRHPEIPLSG